MRWLLLSDTHFTNRFNRKRFDRLVQLISSVDRVILNGDFFDGATSSFDQFCASPWQQLFPLLKKKKTIYLYGNHDPKSHVNKLVREFASEDGERMVLKIGKRRYLIEHGHQILPRPELRSTPFWRMYYRFSDLVQTAIEVPLWYGLGIHHTVLMRFLNAPFHRFAKNLPPHTWLITGHTHTPEYSPHYRYINLGCNRTGMCEYVIIDSKHPHPAIYREHLRVL